MPPYAYLPLQKALHSTRVLQILPGGKGSGIHCQIFDYTIRHDRASGPYEALSYAWGDPAERRRIYVQNHETWTVEPSFLDVTEQLHIALHYLRDPAFPRLMWIDAICIDQANLQERAVQVRFMANTYAHASRVIVWLGEEADDSTRTLGRIEELAAEARRNDADSSDLLYRDSSEPWRNLA